MVLEMLSPLSATAKRLSVARQETFLLQEWGGRGAEGKVEGICHRRRGTSLHKAGQINLFM